MQSALQRDQALALLESGRAPKRAAALSPTTCAEHQLSDLQAA